MLDSQAPLFQHLQDIYGEDEARALLPRLVELLDGWRARIHQRAGADSSESAQPWDQSTQVLITYGDSIQAPGERPLRTLRDFLSERLEGVISTVHILPFFPYTSDDGFSILDYREVNEALGDWDDIEAISAQFGLMVDLVINHCSRESLWFYDYVANVPPYNDYFIEVDLQSPEAGSLDLVTRPRSSPLLTEVRTHRGRKHLWATFSRDQIDLNFRNPDVLLEMIDIMLGYVAAGTRILRLDAVAYLWKEIGTSCIHLHQTHSAVKLIRAVLELVDPRCLVLTETNVPNEENRSYFGLGDEAHMIYQFSLPPLMLHALHTGFTRYLVEWARDTTERQPPAGCTFLNFTASHDGIGVRPLEGLIPREEVDNLMAAMHERGGYVSSRRNSDGSESPYELNISYFDAVGDPRVETDPWKVPCFMVSQIVVISLRGVPAIYLHSLTATPNDHHGVEEGGRTRLINRRKWDRGELEARIDDPATDAGRVFREMVRVLRLRGEHSAFHPDASQQVLSLPDQLFGLVRESDDERVICLFNFTPDTHEVKMEERFWGDEVQTRWKDLLSDELIPIERGRMRLPPYVTYWLVHE